MRKKTPVLLLVLACGCGGPGVSARFGGRTEPQVATVEQIRETPLQLASYRSIGQLTSSCTEPQRARELDGVWLKDVGCSQALLTRALFERAAEVGGELLAERQCEADGEGTRRVRHTCTAWVLRSRDGQRRGAAIPEAREAPPSQVVPASDAWRIQVSLHATGPHRKARAPRPVHHVAETAVPSLSQVPFGEIIAECKGECERSSMYDAVRLAAARVGARSVWGVDCVSQQPGWLCTGHAGVYEVDLAAHPPAR